MTEQNADVVPGAALLPLIGSRLADLRAESQLLASVRSILIAELSQQSLVALCGTGSFVDVGELS